MSAVDGVPLEEMLGKRELSKAMEKFDDPKEKRIAELEAENKAIKAETYLCGDGQNIVCARCGAREPIGFPCSVEEFVKKTKLFNKAHQHKRVIVLAGGMPLSYIKRMMQRAE